MKILIKFVFVTPLSRSERRGGTGAPVAADQALAFAQKAGASMYVDTSAKMSRKTVIAAFELAATVAATARLTLAHSRSSQTESQLSTPSPKSKPIKKQRFSSSSASTEESPSSPDSSLDRTTTGGVEPAAAAVRVWDQFQDGASAKSSTLREDLCFPMSLPKYYKIQKN